MVQINLVGNSSGILVANNNDKLQAYEFLKKKAVAIRINQDDAYAIVHKKDGSSFKQEIYLGSGYLSSSSTMLCYAEPVVSVTIYDNKGKKRDIPLNSK